MICILCGNEKKKVFQNKQKEENDLEKCYELGKKNGALRQLS